MRIETKIDSVRVEIEGRVYALAEKTIAVAEALRRVRRKYRDTPGYRLWLAELRVLLGKRTVKKLFTDGERENLDRMQRIHDGVLSAFDYNANKLREDRIRREQEPIESVRGLYRQIEKTIQAADGANMRK